jgi:4-hydroxy-tetrahydrodipicolinate synthase
MYNVPGRTNVNLLPESVKKIVDNCPNYIGIKEASGDLSQMIKIKTLCPNKFYLYCGDDALVVQAFAIGAYGLISVISNVIPKTIQKIVSNSTNPENFQTYNKLSELIEALFVEPNPSPIKFLCKLFKKIDYDTVRLPLVPVQSEELKIKLSYYYLSIKDLD